MKHAYVQRLNLRTFRKSMSVRCMPREDCPRLGFASRQATMYSTPGVVATAEMGVCLGFSGLLSTFHDH